MGALTELQESGTQVTVVGIGTDPNEDAEAILAHVVDNGFEGTYANAPQELLDAMVEQFGPEIITPPTSPVVLISADQTEARLLDRGFKDVDTLKAALEEGP